MTPAGGPGLGDRHARASRIPAVTILLLVLVVIMGAGLAFGYSPARPAPEGMTLGVGAAVYAGSGPGGYSRAELAALSSPLPAGAVAVHVPVLMYHYVDAEPPPVGPYADGLTVRTPDFTEEMDYLVEHGYHTVTLADAYLAMAGLEQLPDKPVALTFDDGGLDNYEVAFPILEERGLIATFFVITKTVGAMGQMDWDQLREMAAAGMSIQSHSVSHPGLTGVSDARLESELVDSRSAIIEAVDEPGYVLCYPSGAYDDRVVGAAKAAGYVMAVATDVGEELSPDTVFEITRRRVQAFLPLSSFANLVK
jgi:peptidoglycan/xylan/chitin deacetylase (PgdA/CDA1 family)